MKSLCIPHRVTGCRDLSCAAPAQVPWQSWLLQHRTDVTSVPVGHRVGSLQGCRGSGKQAGEQPEKPSFYKRYNLPGCSIAGGTGELNCSFWGQEGDKDAIC